VNDIIGHDSAITAFVEQLKGARLHHAWLLYGPEGIGKASLAQLLAKYALCAALAPIGSGAAFGNSYDNIAAKLIDAGSHPDLFLLERLPRDSKLVRDIARSEWPAGLERARSINVEQVRELVGKFALKPALSDRRIVIIDSIDDMERAGANALLKSLEEPPAGTVFLLVSHSPGRLLPTIRSRCRAIRLSPLADDEMRIVLRRHLPQIDDSELTVLIGASGGSPGSAMKLAGLDIAGIDAALAQIASDGDVHNAIRTGLAQALSLKAAQQRYEAFLARVPAFIATEAKRRSGAGLALALNAWEESRQVADNAIRLSLDSQMTVFALGGIVAALAPHRADAKA
jgi:DNA polymerase III subunit delta'